MASLQEMGYERIAIGGLVPLKTHEIVSVLDAVSNVRAPHLQLHLFGVTRFELVPLAHDHGVTSFDTTSPFRRAFKDSTHNYYALDPKNGDQPYVALRVPQVEGNIKLGALIRSGRVQQEEARALERATLAALRAFDRGKCSLDEALDALCAYQGLHDPEANRRDQYRRMLADAPWKSCDCTVCRDVGLEVALFRGTERNKRRGFHNMHVYAKQLAREIDVSKELLLAA